MEKSSEKLIRGTSPLKSRLKDMLSEVQIKVPAQIQAKKKQKNLVLEIDQYFERNISQTVQGGSSHQDTNKRTESLGTFHQKQNKFTFNFHLKNKTPSFIKELVTNQRLPYYAKCGDLLDKHLSSKLKQEKNQLLEYSFNMIKNHVISDHYTFNEASNLLLFNKVSQFISVLKRIESMRVRGCFQKLAKLSKDSLLSGLSNTVGDLKNNSLLKPESQYRYLKRQTGKLLKGQPIRSDKDMSIGIVSKKVVESAASESLSGLILNHNKLNIPTEGNQEYPNIPKSNRNISNKLIASNKDIAELSLQTKRKIESNKKLAQAKDLPLETKKNICDKDNNEATKQSVVKDEQKCPITFTFILKNLDFNKLMPSNISKENHESKKKFESQFGKSNAINGVSLVQSHYQQPIRNIFLEPPKQQKRSISLQIKQLPGLFVSSQKPINLPNFIKKYNDQYYNQFNCNRQNLRRVNYQHLGTNQVKQRPHSAAPKITFSFYSSNHPPAPINNNHAQKYTIKGKYEEADCIVQSLLNEKNAHLLQINSHKQINQHSKNNRFQVVSPSQRRQERNSNQKLKQQQRLHIKEKILPPALGQYYNNEQPQIQRRVPLLSGSCSSTSLRAGSDVNQVKKNQLKQFKKELVKQLYFGQIQQQQGGCLGPLCQKSQQSGAKLKSHKERIMVTYSNKQ